MHSGQIHSANSELPTKQTHQSVDVVWYSDMKASHNEVGNPIQTLDAVSMTVLPHSDVLLL